MKKVYHTKATLASCLSKFWCVLFKKIKFSRHIFELISRKSAGQWLFSFDITTFIKWHYYDVIIFMIIGFDRSKRNWERGAHYYNYAEQQCVCRKYYFEKKFQRLHTAALHTLDDNINSKLIHQTHRDIKLCHFAALQTINEIFLLHSPSISKHKSKIHAQI